MVDAICLGLNARPEGLNQIYNISNGDPELLWPLLDDVFDRLGLAPVDKTISGTWRKALPGCSSGTPWLNGHKEPYSTVYGVEH